MSRINPDDNDYPDADDSVKAKLLGETEDVDEEIYNQMVDKTFPRPEGSVTSSIAKTSMRRENKTFFQRLLAPIGPGSLRSSTFILMSNMIGVGNLALPHALYQAGLVLGVIFLTTGALLGIWSNNCLTTVAFKKNLGKYSDVVDAVLGPKWSKAFQGIFLFYMFGSMTNFQITAAHFLQDVLQDVFGVSDAVINSSWERPIQILGVNLLLYWIARAKNLYALRHITFVTVFVLLYTTMVVLIQSPSYFRVYFDASLIQPANFNLNALSAYAVTAFSYFCQAIILPIKSDLAKPAKVRMGKIIRRAFAVIWLLYVLVAVVGYLCLVGAPVMPQVIPDRPQLGAHDIAMNIARGFLAINIMFGIAIRLNPTRLQLHILSGKPQTNKWNEIFTFILLFGSAGLAIVFPDIYSLMTIIGGFGAVSIAYFFPGLIYMKFMNYKRDWKVIGSGILVVVSSILGITPTIVTIINMVNGTS